MPWSNDELRRRVSEITRTYGDWVIWEKGLPCACRAAAGLRMSAGCAKCEGAGLVWDDPTRTKGILMPAHSDRRLASMGWLSPADMILSTDASTLIHDFDRITLLTPLPTEPEVIVRGQAFRDGTPGLGPLEDRLAYAAQRAILCRRHDPPGCAFVFGDAYVFAGKTVRWLAPPSDGTVYLIQYEALFEWLAFASPVEVIDRGKRLGQRVVLRRRHLVNLAENPTRDVAKALGM